ncbi:MAG TPA: response regulator [Candidatus Dormibacteraeota bacterium]|nr:response regulator [Candidatus Dormibacteraeota bacterium]
MTRLTQIGAQRSREPEGSQRSRHVDILMVEDNPYDVDLMTHALKDYVPLEQIKVVNDGEEALDFLFSQGKYAKEKAAARPRLILLDLHLPGIGGLEVLRQIRADSRTREIPVAILTQSKEDENVVDGYKLGANSFLVKRQDFNEFMKAAQALGVYWLVMNRTALKTGV